MINNAESIKVYFLFLLYLISRSGSWHSEVRLSAAAFTNLPCSSWMRIIQGEHKVFPW
jgi:hypothetical protein